MKKLGKLKLHQLSKAELDERALCCLLGGGTPGNCQCGCHYANSGGSSTSANDSANNAGGLYSDPYDDTPSQAQCPSCPPTQAQCPCPPPAGQESTCPPQTSCPIPKQVFCNY